MLRFRSSRVIPSRASCACSSSSLPILFSFLMLSITSLMYSGRRRSPASSARCTSSSSSTASWRIFALFSRRNWGILSGSMRAAWAAASCRDWNSLWVMISPFTFAMTRSGISARAAATTKTPPRRRLGRRTWDAECRRMIHLGPLEEGGHELAHLAIRLLPDEPGADAGLHLLEAHATCGLPGLDPQNMIPERGLDDLARRPRGEGEGRLLQLRGQLPAREGAHEAAVRGLRAPGDASGERLEGLGLLDEPTLDVARLVHRRHQDLPEGDLLLELELLGVVVEIGGDLLVAHADLGERLLEELLYRPLLFRRGARPGQESPGARLEHEHALLEEGVEQAAPDLGSERGFPPRLDLGEVAREIAAPHGLVAQLEDDGVGGRPLATRHRRRERGRRPEPSLAV